MGNWLHGCISLLVATNSSDTLSQHNCEYRTVNHFSLLIPVLAPTKLSNFRPKVKY
jgi:hypothetical protein